MRTIVSLCAAVSIATCSSAAPGGDKASTHTEPAAEASSANVLELAQGLSNLARAFRKGWDENEQRLAIDRAYREKCKRKQHALAQAMREKHKKGGGCLLGLLARKIHKAMRR